MPIKLDTRQLAGQPAETLGRQARADLSTIRHPIESTHPIRVFDFLIDGMLRASYKKPGAASTARARHRRADLPCARNLSILVDLLRDLRHQQAAAYQDLHDWIVYLTIAGKRPKTLYGYGREIACLLVANPDTPFDEFTTTMVAAQIILKSERSRHITRSIYNSWFTWGHQDGGITTNPMGRVPKIKNPSRRPKDIFDPVEIELLENLPSPDGELWTLLFKTGLRRGEARRLNRAHINLDRARLMVHDGKGGKDRIIGMPPAALAAVADLDLSGELGPYDYLWYSHPGGTRRRVRHTPIADTTFSRGPKDPNPGWYERGITAAGVRYLNPHQTRHTYGWWLRAEGFDIEERQLLMGHESIRTTEEYYGRLTVDDLTDKIAMLV